MGVIKAKQYKCPGKVHRAKLRKKNPRVVQEEPLDIIQWVRQRQRELLADLEDAADESNGQDQGEGQRVPPNSPRDDDSLQSKLKKLRIRNE